MNEIIELAGRLGKAIADSAQALKLREARKALHSQADIMQVMKDYQAQAEKIARLEDEKKPVEVDDKHKLDGLHGKLISSEVFKKYTSAQVDYIDLMRKVNEALRGQLAATEKE